MAEYKVLEFMVGSYGTKKWLENPDLCAKITTYL